jgi:hypothetical protein
MGTASSFSLILSILFILSETLFFFPNLNVSSDVRGRRRRLLHVTSTQLFDLVFNDNSNNQPI